MPHYECSEFLTSSPPSLPHHPGSSRAATLNGLASRAFPAAALSHSLLNVSCLAFVIWAILFTRSSQAPKHVIGAQHIFVEQITYPPLFLISRKLGPQWMFQNRDSQISALPIAREVPGENYLKITQLPQRQRVRSSPPRSFLYVYWVWPRSCWLRLSHGLFSPSINKLEFE